MKLLVITLVLAFINLSGCIPVPAYLEQRSRLVETEFNRFLGSDMWLDTKEIEVNRMLMKMKEAAFNRSIHDAHFDPATHFFKAKADIEKSDIFKFIKAMPKGAALHVHDTAITSIDFIVSDLTYWTNLYVCNFNSSAIRFRFFETPDRTCNWVLVASLREQLGNKTVDVIIKKAMSLVVPDPRDAYPDINTVWNAFEQKMTVISDVYGYVAAFKHHFRRALEEFHEDGVIYFELRTTLTNIYEINGTSLDKFQVMQLYKEGNDEYVRDNPDFKGTKMIYSVGRIAPDHDIGQDVSDAITFHNMYPDFFGGFDLVGQEDTGRPLLKYIDQLLLPTNLGVDLKYFFHAAETDWEGTPIDGNLYDAILLNTSRIGHGFGLTKHPTLMGMVKSKGIAVEVCPISNQVLDLVADLRNHPGAVLLSDNYPVVISSDDPIVWEARPLSHDFYMAFMGLAGEKSDLRFLKRLAMNSIEYSAMSEVEKTAALEMWGKKWDKFIDTFIKKCP